MKKTFSLLAVLLVTQTVFAQELDRYNQNNLKSMSLDEKSFIQSAGFPLSRYSFNNEEINSELNVALKSLRETKKYNKYSIIGAAAGLLVAVVPIGNDLNGVVAKRAVGLGLIAGGVVTFYIGMGKKQKAVKRIQNANYQYSVLQNN